MDLDSLGRSEATIYTSIKQEQINRVEIEGLSTDHAKKLALRIPVILGASRSLIIETCMRNDLASAIVNFGGSKGMPRSCMRRSS